MLNNNHYIKEFIALEYLITPTINTIKIIQSSGFSKINLAEPKGNIEYRTYDKIQKNIRGKDLEGLCAKVFSLAWPYDEVILTQSDKTIIKDWSRWLANAEFDLRKITNDTNAREKIFKKTIAHLLKAQEYGDKSNNNKSLIANCYLNLGQYGYALIVLQELIKKDNNPRNNFHIGKCYFGLRKYEEALGYFRISASMGNGSKENCNLMGRCCYNLRDYESALTNLMKSREAGNNNPNNAYLIQRCIEILEVSNSQKILLMDR